METVKLKSSSQSKARPLLLPTQTIAKQGSNPRSERIEFISTTVRFVSEKRMKLGFCWKQSFSDSVIAEISPRPRHCQANTRI
ncbi:hypothetical protein SLA2020_297340 [Shorea laevis]